MTLRGCFFSQRQAEGGPDRSPAALRALTAWDKFVKDAAPVSIKVSGRARATRERRIIQRCAKASLRASCSSPARATPSHAAREQLHGCAEPVG